MNEERKTYTNERDEDASVKGERAEGAPAKTERAQSPPAGTGKTRRAAAAADAVPPHDAAADESNLVARGQPGVLAVTAAGAEFGLPVDAVQEVVRIPHITRLPFPPPSIRGVTSVRGEVVTVMDLGERLLGRSSDPERRLVVVTDPTTGEKVGLLVEDVAGLVAQDREQPTPAETEASLPDGWIERLVSPSPERMVTVLRLAPVLALHATTPNGE